MRAELGELNGLFDALHETRCELQDHEAHMRWELHGLPPRVQGRLQRGKSLFKQVQVELKGQLISGLQAFEAVGENLALVS